MDFIWLTIGSCILEILAGFACLAITFIGVYTIINIYDYIMDNVRSSK